MFLSTQSAENPTFPLDFIHQDAALAYPRENAALLPLAVYGLHWDIEGAYYEQKTFWGLGAYMLQSKTGEERNFLSLVFAVLILLPFQSQVFSALKGHSPQEIRFRLGQLVQQQVFLTTFDCHLKSGNIFKRTLDCLILDTSCFENAA